MITTCTIMRIDEGIWCRSNEMNRLEKAVTSITAMPITTDKLMLVVMASAEQIPSTCRAMGLLLKSGVVRTPLGVKADIVRLLKLQLRVRHRLPEPLRARRPRGVAPGIHRNLPDSARTATYWLRRWRSG